MVIEEFKQYSKECTDALNNLLQSEYICLNDKHIMRLNRFKRWLLELTNEVTADETDNDFINN